MLKTGDKAIVRNNDGGHFYKGKHVVVLQVMPPTVKKPILVRALYGTTESWYDEKDLEKIGDDNGV